MVWFSEHSIDPVKNAATVKEVCVNCSNEVALVLLDQPYGLGIGIPFAKRPLFSARRAYFLGCPICGYLNERITKDEAQALMHRGAR